MSFSKLSKKPAEKYILLCGDIFAICKIVSRTKCTLENLYSVNELILAPAVAGSPQKQKLILNLTISGTDGNLNRSYPQGKQPFISIAQLMKNTRNGLSLSL
jgi:hypothetical protein